MVFDSPSSAKHEQAWQSNTCLQCCLNYKEVCLNDKLLAGPDLLHGLIGTIFRFREGPTALTADIEAMFLQVQVSEQDRSCLRFLWHPRTNEPVQIYEYQRRVFGAKSSRACANFALR